jgi:hypothetical protein
MEATSLVSVDDIFLKEKTPEEQYYVSRTKNTKSFSITLEDLNRHLPHDVLQKIYVDHFSPESIIHHLMEIIKSEECQRLHYQELGDYLEKTVLPNPVVVKKLQKENPIFEQLYREEIVGRNKHFRLFTNIYHSFALAWLMILYH